MVQLGVVNSLEEEKKVLASRIYRYKKAVPKLIEHLKEFRDEAKVKAGPNNDKAELINLKKALKESKDNEKKITLEKVRVEAEAKMTERMNSNLELIRVRHDYVVKTILT